MKAQSSITQHPTQGGVVLLEVLIAILIFSLGILGIIGLQATMIKSTSDSKYRSDASLIAQRRISEMWADAVNINNYVVVDADISNQIPGGTLTVAAGALANQYQITVNWTQPGEPPHSFVTLTSIVGAN